MIAVALVKQDLFKSHKYVLLCTQCYHDVLCIYSTIVCINCFSHEVPATKCVTVLDIYNHLNAALKLNTMKLHYAANLPSQQEGCHLQSTLTVTCCCTAMFMAKAITCEFVYNINNISKLAVIIIRTYIYIIIQHWGIIIWEFEREIM